MKFRILSVFDTLKFAFNQFSRAVILWADYGTQVRQYYHKRI